MIFPPKSAHIITDHGGTDYFTKAVAFVLAKRDMSLSDALTRFEWLSTDDKFRIEERAKLLYECALSRRLAYQTSKGIK